ncbi:MAG TPA: DNA polymerase III subunit delta [Saprospiraceae bacterium]|nr:DNA polymerase III subunit delta [Saprospiraceae bacterium]
MSIDQIHKDIKAGKFFPIYLLHGEEAYLIDEAAELLEESIVEENAKPFDQQILYGTDCDARYVLEQLMLFPLLAPKRLVLIREAQLMADIKDLEGYATKPAPSSVLVLCHKGKSLDKRLKLYDAIKKNGFILAADPLKEKEVIPWLMHTSSELGIKLEVEAAEALVELIGGDISKLYPELKKLKGIHTLSDSVSRTEIIDLVGMSREYNVFELQDALESGDSLKMMKIAMIMADHKDYSVIMLVATLAGYFTRMYAVKSMGNADDTAIAEAIGIKSSWVIKKYKSAAYKYSIGAIERIIGWLHVYDMKAKGWSYKGGDERALTIELLGHIMHPDREPMEMKHGA